MSKDYCAVDSCPCNGLCREKHMKLGKVDCFLVISESDALPKRKRKKQRISYEKKKERRNYKYQDDDE